MKRTFATSLALFLLTLVCHAENYFYFGRWETVDGSAGYAYATENADLNTLSVTLVGPSGVVQERKGTMNRTATRFTYIHPDRRKMLLTYSRRFPRPWKGTSKLIDGKTAKISMMMVSGPMWEVLGFPPSP